MLASGVIRVAKALGTLPNDVYGSKFVALTLCHPARTCAQHRNASSMLGGLLVRTLLNFIYWHDGQELEQERETLEGQLSVQEQNRRMTADLLLFQRSVAEEAQLLASIQQVCLGPSCWRQHGPADRTMLTATAFRVVGGPDSSTSSSSGPSSIFTASVLNTFGHLSCTCKLTLV